MAYTRVNWQDSPSTATPISASNLNKMDKGIKDLEDSLATVATTGDYDDLIDTPNLSTVATSGSYNDLTNKPQEHLVNIGTSVDSSYRTNISKGKNLFNKDGGNKINAYLPSSTGSIQSNENARTIYCECKPNTTYTIKKGTSNRFIIGTTTSVPTIGVEDTFIVRDDSATQKTITTGANAKFICVYYTASAENIDSTIMINEGSEALPYESYVVPSIIVDNDEIYNQNIMNYSTEEQVIGKWLGKPLYRKVVSYTNSSTIGALNDITSISIPHNINNFKNIVKASAVSSTGNVLPIQSGQSTSNASVSIPLVESTNITFRIINLTLSARTWYFILEYTKTTD